MSTKTATLDSARSATQIVGYDDFIEGQLQKTRSQVKWCDISSAAMTLLAGTLVYLFAVALVDHWVLSGGLGFWGRLLCLAVLLIGGTAYAVTALLPLLMHRINPVYAAHAIEQSRPTLKNSLVNFLLLRSSRVGISDSVYRAIEQQAASKLSQVHVESAVDRSKLVKIFAVLLVVVTACCLYTVLSPKNPLRTVRRVILPWADISAPTRVTIAEVSPGDTSAFHEGYVNVQAVVRGVRDGDPVTLFYSTLDGQTVEQPIAMQRPADAYRHACVLPAASGGLRQSVRYYITAGDARTPVYEVEVLPAPTIAVERVEYQYPKYTGLEPATAGHGDLKALEGTRVTLHARANQDIGKAYLDLDCKGQRNKSLSVEGREARVTLPLRFQAGSQSPEFASYQVRFTNAQGHENPQPIRHTVEIVRDRPPEAKLLEPEEPQLDLPLNRRLQLKVRAVDPDFALSKVEIVTERVNQSGDVLWASALLDTEHVGEFEGTVTFDPEKLKLKVGDEVRYWAEARDNRRPDDAKPAEPNRGESERHKIRIVAAEQPRSNEVANNDRRPNEQRANDAQPNRDNKQPRDQGAQQQGDKQAPGKPEKGQPQQQPQPGDKPNEQQRSDQPGQAGDRAADTAPSANEPGGKPNGEPKPGEKGSDNNAGNNDRRVDPMTNPGDAFDEILRQKQRDDQENGDKQADKPEKPQPQDRKNPNEAQQPSPEQKQPSANDQGSKQQGSKQQGDKQQGGQQSGNKQQGDKQQGDKQQGGQQQGDKQQGGAAGQKPDAGGQKGANNQGASDASKSGEQQGTQPQAGTQTKGGANTPTATNQPDEQTAPNGEQKPQGAGDAAGANKPGEKTVPGEQPQGPEKPAPGEKGTPTNDKPQGDKPPGGEAAKSGDNATPPSPDAAKPAAGKGSEVKGAGDPNQKPTDDVNKKPSEGGDRDSEKGNNPGAALKSGDDKPTPSPQEKNQDNGPKKQNGPQPGDNASNQGENAPSPSNSPKQSDSQGGADGDRSGGGKKGGGQPSSGADGTGGPGQNTASDQGNKKAPGAGQGETSDKAGGKVESNKPTGSSDPSGKTGDGSQQKAGGDKPGGEKPGAGQSPAAGEKPMPQPGAGDPKGDNAAAKPNANPDQRAGNTNDPRSNKPNNKPAGNKPANDNNAANDKGDGNPSSPGGNQPAGGTAKPGEANNQGNPTSADGQPGQNRNQAKPQEPAGEAANLDYAKKATDLALEHLKDQLAKDKPDPELLDKLKWSREDMQRFVDHWERMKRDAQTPGATGEAARKKLDESLRGLGLRPQGTNLPSNETSNDQQRNVRSSRGTAPPAEFAEQVKAYKQRLAKGQKSEK